MITIINGRRTQGKTTLAYRVSLRRPTRLIFDPRRTFSTTLIVTSNIWELYDLLDTEPEIIFQPIDDVQSDFRQCADIFREWCVNNPDEPACFLVDEAMFIDTPNIDYPAFEQTMRFSKPELIDVVITSHRPSDIAVNIRAIADFLIFFRTTQEHDLKIIRERCGDVVAEKVSELPDKHYVLWNDRDGTFWVVSDPETWYIDIAQVQTTEKPQNA